MGLDVTRLPGTIMIILPLAVVGWTGSSAYTLDETTVTYVIARTPGAVTMFVQILAPILVVVDWCSLMLLSCDHIVAKIVIPVPSCFSGSRQSE